jgi:hypothetical protein
VSALPPMQLFRNVPVVPVSQARRSVPTGGPIWPDFSAQVRARHCRDGRPSDRMPRPPAWTLPVSEPAVWGGFLIRQFGHLVAEHLTRLPQSLRDRPEDLYLFTVAPGDDRDRLAGHIWELLDWHGVPRDRLRIVTRPVLARDLACG